MGGGLAAHHCPSIFTQQPISPLESQPSPGAVILVAARMEVIVIADEEQETQQPLQDEQELVISNSELVAIFYKKVFNL
jgi:hypothetical protein